MTEMLGERAHDDTIRGAAFNIGQIAAATKDSNLAKDTVDQVTAHLVPDEVKTRGGATAIWDSFDLPPAGRWPRIISRASAKHFEKGRIALFVSGSHQAKPVAEFFESDSIRAIRYRAAIAAPWIVAAKVNPSIVDKYIP